MKSVVYNAMLFGAPYMFLVHLSSSISVPHQVCPLNRAYKVLEKYFKFNNTTVYCSNNPLQCIC